ncbi:thiamine phosphate synthase [Caulobacter henricii]|uniref:thiamine phosphate synthase n=1 Tax=Caulobacter henricii TaxID=69395 RepID=UPI00157AF6F3|nr:thiamine phosphate synthase [Caulobacter henricii]
MIVKTGGELEALSRTARTLAPRTVRGIVLPSLVFFTDPARVPDPESVAERLPRHAAVVFRAFGAAHAVDQGHRLRRIADRRGLLLLVGADEDLAETIGADGLHLPQRLGNTAPAIRARRSDWLLTQAAHDAEAVGTASALGADALFVSPVFASNSPSAGTPLGVEGLRRWVGMTDTPIYALGGIRAETVEQLEGTGIVGLAAVDALLS